MGIYLAATEDTNIKAKTIDQNIMIENSSIGTFRMNIFVIKYVNGLELKYVDQ